MQTPAESTTEVMAESGWKCPAGHQVGDDNAFCGVCGAAQSTTTSPIRRYRWPLVAAAALLAAVGIAVATSAAGGGAGVGAQDEDPVVTGSVTIFGFSGSSPCVGDRSDGTMAVPHDYTDLRGGTSVRVLDADGTILGSGSLADGRVTDQGCRLDFRIPLDDATSRYQLVIGDRPAFDFTSLDGLDLTIGA
jgi:hypothetical protein